MIDQSERTYVTILVYVLRKEYVGGISYIRDQYKSERKNQDR